MLPYLLIIVAGFFGFFAGAGLMAFFLVKSANEEVQWNEANRRYTKTMTSAILQMQRGGKDNHQEIK